MNREVVIEIGIAFHLSLPSPEALRVPVIFFLSTRASSVVGSYHGTGAAPPIRCPLLCNVTFLIHQFMPLMTHHLESLM